MPKPDESQDRRDPHSNTSTSFQIPLLKITAGATALFGLGYVMACLMGFGAALAIETELAVPADALYESSLHLVALTKYPLMALLSGINGLSDQLVPQVLSISWPFWIVSLITAVAAKQWMRLLKGKVPGRPSRVPLKLKAAVSWFPQDVRPAQKLLVLISGGLFFAPMVVAFAWRVALLVILVPVICLPMLGFFGTQAWMKEWVFRSAQCQALQTERIGRSVRTESLTANALSDDEPATHSSQLPCIQWSDGALSRVGMVLVGSPAALVVLAEDRTIRLIKPGTGTLQVVSAHADNLDRPVVGGQSGPNGQRAAGS